MAVLGRVQWTHPALPVRVALGHLYFFVLNAAMLTFCCAPVRYSRRIHAAAAAVATAVVASVATEQQPCLHPHLAVPRCAPPVRSEAVT